jgi:prophage maintenance system killer protein
MAITLQRVGHAAMLAFLRLNGRTLEANIDEAERTILQVASVSHPASSSCAN